jgi:hypothetical protein
VRAGRSGRDQTPTNSNVANSRTESLDLDSTDMVTIGGTWTSRWLGIKNQQRRCAAQLTMNTATAPPAGIVNTGIPNVSSPLVNDATGKSAWDDFYGTVRGATRDRGAVEG